jgi:diguanylate cyclase (GGDEF)-like protein
MRQPEEDEVETTQAISLSDLLKGAAPEQRRLTATLTVIAGRAAGKIIKLGPGETVLGRAADVTIPIEDEGVSRRHAAIVEQNGTHVLRDLGSRNGTLCNGARVEAPAVLHDGDRIRIGATTIFKFGYQDEAEERLQAQLYDSATRDALTHAYNRRSFNERLASEWAWATRHKTPCSLIAIDADHFKHINDGYGHPAGDYVLKELVATVQRVVRREDMVARIGGEEFMVLARATTRAQALLLAERIRTAVAAHVFEFNGTRLPVTISLGVATSEDLGVESPEDLIGRADEYLYRAKENGRNRVEPQPK